MKMNSKGQATAELLVYLPMFVALIGGSMFVVYAGLQGVRVQQAANLAARMQGQERISGGVSQPAIEQENGTGIGQGDPDPSSAQLNGKKFTGSPAANIPNTSVFGKYYNLIKEQFFPNATKQIFIPAPHLGQNIDQVKVIRTIDLPKIPFFNWGGQEQLQFEGIAWGGEDTYAYGLPRWGKAGGNESQWRLLAQQSANTKGD